jgi:hypothetical protein
MRTFFLVSFLAACGSTNPPIDPDAADPVDASPAIDSAPGSTTWVVADALPDPINPNGPWTYAYEHSVGAAPIEFPMQEVVTDAVVWYDPADFDSSTPAAFENTSDQTQNGNPPGSVGLHPGLAGQLTGIRFVAPADGTYTADITASAGDAGSTTAAVFVDGNVALDFTSTDTEPTYHLAPTAMTAGTAIWLWISPDGDGYGDTTPVTFTVTSTP